LLARRIILSVITALACGMALAEDFAVPEINLPKDPKHPFLACSAEELARLREAYRSKGPAHDVVARVVKKADKIIAQPVVFPPRGGQHNQWYQCDQCETALKTIDATHHQCPVCKKVYSGEPYDDVIFGRIHRRNLSNMTTAAWAYALTGEKKYAEYAAKVLLGYAERYKKYPYHGNSKWNLVWVLSAGGHLFEQTLSEASSMATHIAPAYDLIHNSGVLSEEDHKAIRQQLILPMLQNIDKNKWEKGNWQSWHNAAMFWGGAMLGDVSWLRKAVAAREYGFLDQMRNCVSSDGMWYEGSWGYHFYALRALTALAEGARRTGTDLWEHPQLRKMFILPVQYTMADGTLPRFGDDVRSSVKSVPDLLETAYHATKDRAILALLPDRPRWETVLYGRDWTQRAKAAALESGVFTGAGHAILRTKGEAGLTAAFTFGPYGGYHGHYDKLSFVFFGFSKELGVDPGRAKSQAYRLPIHKKWYKPTIGHNAVLVDRKSQRGAAGKLLLFAANERFAAAAASCSTAYPGVRQRRLLVMAPSYLLVVDDLASSSEHRFDWVYHNRGSNVECAAATKKVDLTSSGNGFEYIRNAKTGRTDAPVCARFVDEAVTTHLIAALGADTEVLTGDGPAASVKDRVPLIMLGRRGKAAQFAVVLEPVRSGDKPLVSAVDCATKDGTLTITVRADGRADQVTWTGANQLTVVRNGKAALRRE